LCRSSTNQSSAKASSITTGVSGLAVSHSSCDGYFRRFLKNYHSAYLANSVATTQRRDFNMSTSDYYQVMSGERVGGYQDCDEESRSPVTRKASTFSKAGSSMNTRRYAEFKKMLKSLGKKGMR
jgi:hypothetical protein